MNHRSPKFTSYCRMTCLGGSERGECECRRPAECQLSDNPHYEDARASAKARMIRYLLNAKDETN